MASAQLPSRILDGRSACQVAEVDARTRETGGGVCSMYIYSVSILYAHEFLSILVYSLISLTYISYTSYAHPQEGQLKRL